MRFRHGSAASVRSGGGFLFRSRGEFAGVSLAGSSLEVHRDSSDVFYGKPRVDPLEIVEGKTVKHRSASRRLTDEIGRHVP